MKSTRALARARVDAILFFHLGSIFLDIWKGLPPIFHLAWEIGTISCRDIALTFKITKENLNLSDLNLEIYIHFWAVLECYKSRTFFF